MKKTIILAFLLVAVISNGISGQVRRKAVSVEAFWQKFKKAVAAKNTENIAALSAFPVRMPYGIKSLRNKMQLKKNYREVFSRQTNAAKCFDTAKPEIDPDNAKLFTIACADDAGNETVIYNFVKTKTGWKFAALDNINE